MKRVMFAYILEVLNREAPKAFFDLTKGPSLAAKAQKEKKRLARRRNRASRSADEASGKGGEAKGKGKTKTPATSNKPKAPAKSWPAPPAPYKVDPPPTTALEAAKQRAPNTPIVVTGPATYFEQHTEDAPRGTRHSTRLNTAKKRGTRQRVMESVIDKP
ncbi:hypothetical protein BGW80DRAFT_1467807 [Lactifluus volemus]|nr:hypothetical protein BGW80DRAFT_1467807 [Lactifluus volemus]